MKKSKLSITLVTGFIAAMALSACSDVTSSKKAILTFTPYDNSKERVDLLTDDLYQAYGNTTAGISKLYDKILEVLIRYHFKEGNFGGNAGEEKVEMKYKEIEVWANNQVQEQKDKAKENAKSNNTKYDTEWDSILESNSVENAEELKQKFIYEKEKEVIKNWYADNDKFAADLKNEFLGIDKDGNAVQSNVKAAMPYHISHILVKVEESGDANEKFSKGTVTEQQATLLYNTVSTLASGTLSFSKVAEQYSEDGSASVGGDVGIMTNDATSGALGMVNEFQLGLYAYDNLYDGAKAGADVIKEGLGLNSVVGTAGGVNVTAADALPNEATVVPYEAFINMGTYAKITADKEGNKLAGGSASLYPRNILWNKYLNIHNVFVIKNVTKAAYPTLGAAGASNEFKNLADENNVFDASLELDASDTEHTGFRNGILTDEHGRPIIGVRSQYGIHFMVIKKSMYEFNTLATYYDTKLPTDTDYNPDSYVGYLETAPLESFKKRADDVKSKITSFDSTYDYRLYNYLLTKVNVDWSGDEATKLKGKIESYINAQQENNSYKQEDGLKKVWRTYTELLAVQDDNRSSEYTTINAKGTPSGTLTRLVPEQVADDFYLLYTDPYNNAGLYDAFQEEGGWYYYA